MAEVLDQMARAADAAGMLDASRRARIVWDRVNGDVERAHTCGVYVAEARRAGQDPVLCVYVDSRARAVDFRANREVYLARLAAAGLRFSDLRVEQSRYAATGAASCERAGAVVGTGAAAGAAGAAGASGAAGTHAHTHAHLSQPAPEPLDPEVREEVEDLVGRLPEGLRQSVERAVAASEGTQSDS